MATRAVSLEIEGEIVTDGSAELVVERWQRRLIDGLGDEHDVESADIRLTGNVPNVTVERRIRIGGGDRRDEP